METHRRTRAQIQTTESNKKRKMCPNDVVQVHQEPEAVCLVDEIGGLGGRREGEEVGLLPWWPSEMIDEQMSWSMVWLPNWDAEFVGRAYHLLYGDVAWDDDIWGLKSIHQIPTSEDSVSNL